MADAGVNQYTFHVEATEDVPDVCRKVKESGMMVGSFVWNHWKYFLFLC